MRLQVVDSVTPAPRYPRASTMHLYLHLHRHRRSMIGALLSGWLAISCNATFAANLPEAGDVVVGDVTISQSDASSMLLKQQSNHAAVSWRSFSVPDNAILEIEQPSNASLLINRVTGSQPSVISGEIRSTGIVMLVNPNGISITPEANIQGTAFLVSNKEMDQAALAEARWTGLPRLLEVAAGTAAHTVNRDVPARILRFAASPSADSPDGARVSDFPKIVNGAIVANSREHKVEPCITEHGPSVVAVPMAAPVAAFKPFVPTRPSTRHLTTLSTSIVPSAVAPPRLAALTPSSGVARARLPGVRPFPDHWEHPYHLFGIGTQTRSISHWAAPWTMRVLRQMR